MKATRSAIPDMEDDLLKGNVIRASKIKIYIRLMETLGISAKKLLAETNIDPKLLQDAESLITRDMYYAVIMNMIKLSGNPGIAFSLGKVVDISDYGIVGYAMLSCRTVRQALNIHRQYINSLLINPIRIGHASNTPEGGYEMTLNSPSQIEIFRRFEIEECLVVGFRILEIMTGIYPTKLRLFFSYPKPAYHAMYKAFFNCPMEFNAPQTLVRAQGLNFETPIPTSDIEHYKACTQHCQQVMQSLQNQDPLKSSLRELFLTRPGDLPDLAFAAKALGMSERNLRRRLSVNGLSFRALKEEFRFDLSRQLLVSGGMAPKEISYFLGYSTPDGFHRAFKVWTGKTIGQFLKNKD